MGLIKEGDEVRIPTDIQGIEDFLETWIKVAGTEKGITALQMDMKITSGREDHCRSCQPGASSPVAHSREDARGDRHPERGSVPSRSPSAQLPHRPRTDRHGDRPRWPHDQGHHRGTNTKIDIEDGGIVTIASHDGAREEAQKIIEGLTRKVNEGEVFHGSITRIIPIGAFVEILPGKEGMIHISQLSEARVEKVEDVVKVGDEVTVRVREIDNRGRINLTLRGVPQNGDGGEAEPVPTSVASLV